VLLALVANAGMARYAPGWNVAQGCALRMRWKGRRSVVAQFDGAYSRPAVAPKKKMQRPARWLERLQAHAESGITSKRERGRGKQSTICQSTICRSP
jgi:hypothetical protein